MKIESKSVHRLCQALLSLQSEEECIGFLEDLCTVKEILDMGQRLETAVLLDQGVSYQKIIADLGTSTATISRVSRCLNYGSGGYRCVLDRMKKEKN